MHKYIYLVPSVAFLGAWTFPRAFRERRWESLVFLLNFLKLDHFDFWRRAAMFILLPFLCLIVGVAPDLAAWCYRDSIAIYTGGLPGTVPGWWDWSGWDWEHQVEDGLKQGPYVYASLSSIPKVMARPLKSSQLSLTMNIFFGPRINIKMNISRDRKLGLWGFNEIQICQPMFLSAGILSEIFCWKDALKGAEQVLGN